MTGRSRPDNNTSAISQSGVSGLKKPLAPESKATRKLLPISTVRNPKRRMIGGAAAFIVIAPTAQ
ncbi:MAG: hypothetical protein WDN76_09210 [Alphaproteobacteria bacterium]